MFTPAQISTEFFRNQCGMTDLFDLEEPERIGLHEPLCPILFESRSPINPFEKIFQNSEYVVLKVFDPSNMPKGKKKPRV